MSTNILLSFKTLLDTKWSTYHRLLLWVVVSAIFYLATTSVDHKVQSTFNDKFNHLIAFGVLSFLCHIAFQTHPSIRWAIALFGYGLFIELVQYFLPYREFSLLDLATDLLGIVLYLIIFHPVFNRLLSHPSNYYAKKP
ncbi:VanZ family protein [Alkalimarinus sediminis]|uniref:VanZ family protein n=1 Tax=Alkalimarinus sediminis TaxID=1632866 RepID=A0A9E8HGV1_9ALTE|nr:VanZ family protein [Alkalimarinus sediminis]UZW73990.1 VanZ family protein [Alkalimarinus sediminis]